MLVTYEALDAQGQLTRDQMEAVGTREAVEHLRRQGLFVTDIRQASEHANKKASGISSLSPRLPLKVLVMFTRQLAMLLRSGSGLVPAIAALGDHLGFTAGVNRDMITPVVMGKLIAGVLAILVGVWVSRDLSAEVEQSKRMASLGSN